MTRTDLLRRLSDILRRADVDDTELLERELELHAMQDELLDAMTKAGADALNLGRGYVGFWRDASGKVNYERLEPTNVLLRDPARMEVDFISAEDIPRNTPVYVHKSDGRVYPTPEFPEDRPVGRITRHGFPGGVVSVWML